MKKSMRILTLIGAAMSLGACGTSEPSTEKEVKQLATLSLGEISLSSQRLQTEKTFSVLMKAQPIVEGNRPYTGSWGRVNNAYLTGISIPQMSGDVIVHFVKPGYSTLDCNRSSAVVSIRDGGQATEAQIRELFGTSRPTGYIPFVACIFVSPFRQVDSFFLTVHYVKDEKPVSSTDEWYIPGSGTTIRSGTSFSLKNTYYNHYIEYHERKYGINLDWTKSQKKNVQFISESGGNIKYNEPFAIYLPGHGYLKYQKRDYGINIVWDNTPRYQWRATASNQDRDYLKPNSKFTLVNTAVKDEVIYCRRSYGINLTWESDCLETPSGRDHQ